MHLAITVLLWPLHVQAISSNLFAQIAWRLLQTAQACRASLQFTSSYGVNMLTDVETACVALAVAKSVRKKSEKRRRRWMKGWFKKGVHSRKSVEWSTNNRGRRLQVFLRVELLAIIKPKIEKQNTIMRDAVPASQRLSITLRFLATGNTFVSPQSISNIVMETCTSLISSLKDYIQVNKK